MEQYEAVRFDVGLALQDGWELYRPNVGIFVGATTIYFVIMLALGSVPPFGQIISLFIAGPLWGGFSLLTLDADKGTPLDVRRLLDGFNTFWQLTLTYIVSSIFIAIPIVIAIMAILVFIGPTIFESISSNQPPDINTSHLIFIGFSVAAGALMTFIINSWYLFIYFIAVDQKVDFWNAMEESRAVAFAQPFGAIGLFLLLGLINIAGAMALLVGLLFSFPYSLCVLCAAYRQVFPDIQAPDANLKDGAEPENHANLIP